MPIDYSKYPPDWKKIRKRILKRAKNKCELCGLPNYAEGFRDANGKFYSSEEIVSALENRGYDYFENELANVGIDDKPVRIVLTIAHLDHDEENWNVKDDRLRALCQRCHLQYDAPEKRRRIKRKKALGDLFE